MLFSNMKSVGLTVTCLSLVMGCGEKGSQSGSELNQVTRGQGKYAQVNNGSVEKYGSAMKFSIANTYEMLLGDSHPEKIFAQAKDLKVNGIRMWGFWNDHHEGVQPNAGQFNENALRRFDRILDMAREADIKLVLVLGNYWDEYGGAKTYLKWAGENTGDRKRFWTSEKAKELYKNYLKKIVSRYKDHPNVLMWELINEPRNSGDRSGQVVTDWLKEMAQFVRSIDNNHMIASGGEGFLSNPVPGKSGYPWVHNEGVSFEKTCALEEIDVCSIHAWPYNWGLKDPYEAADLVKDWISVHVDIAKKYNKPLYLGEFGFQVPRQYGNNDTPKRDIVYKQAFDHGKGFSQRELFGIGFWHLTTKSSPYDTDQARFEVYCPYDKTCDLIRDFSSSYTGR